MSHPVAHRLTNALSPTEATWIGLVVLAELLVIVGYFGLTPAEPTSLRYALYPFVWINVGLWAVVKTTPPSGKRRHRSIAVFIALAYVLTLSLTAGLIGIHPGQHNHHAHGLFGLHATMGAPGWGPAVAYIAPTFHLTFIPYLVIGYLSLAYLVYATVLEATGAAISGVLGLASCVGCAFPVVASLVAGFAGGSSALTTAIYSFSIDISTAVFVLAVALLYWRPGFEVVTRRSEAASESQRSADSNRVSNQQLRYLGAGLAYVVAVIHLFHPTLGMPAFVAYTLAGTPVIDPRPAAFVVSGLAILIGANLVLLGMARKPIYVAGMALMVGYIVGYFGWHMLGHGAWWPWLEHGAHSHTFVEILFGSHHLRADRLALFSKLAELALLIVLSVLYSRE